MGNGRHFFTPVLMNMYNITFQVPRLSIFVFKKSSEIKIFTIIYMNIVLPRFLHNHGNIATEAGTMPFFYLE